MKKAVLFLIVFAAFAFSAHADVITVSNNPDSPGQYTSLQMAIDSSSVGDTLLVAGSNTSYGNVTLYWGLTLIGAGYNNPYGQNTIVKNLNLLRFNANIGASNTRIMGLYFSGGSVSFAGNFSGGSGSQQSIDNVVIERCRFNRSNQGNSIVSFGSYFYNNDTIRNCLFTGSAYGAAFIAFYGTQNNIVMHNNVFSYAYINGSNKNLSSCKLRNNIFIDDGIGNVFQDIKNLVIENNIFYRRTPGNETSGCAYNNNITYLTDFDDIPGPDNIGSGNITATDPEFVNFPAFGADFSWDHDFHLQATSPGKNAGTDGTDIGIYGGWMPFEVGANPYIPQMVEVTLPSGSSVPAGGTLNVHFKAIKQD